MQSNKRVSVLDPRGKPLMPTKASRARRWIRDGKAYIVPSDLNIFTVQLVGEPSGYSVQDVSCGIDPGSCFTGIALQSKHETLVGLNLNLPRKQVQKRMTERAVLRRTRRGRRIKRSVTFKQRNHRQKRLDNRKQFKLPPSIRANKQLELRVINELLKLYPITQFYVERLNKSDTPSFTRAAQGQNYLISEVQKLRRFGGGVCCAPSPNSAQSVLGRRFRGGSAADIGHSLGSDVLAVLVGEASPTNTRNYATLVILVEGWETLNTRQHMGLSKSKNKAEQSPAAHVNDAIALEKPPFYSLRSQHHWITNRVSMDR